MFKQYFISKPGLVGLVLYIIYFRIKQWDIQLIQFTLSIT